MTDPLVRQLLDIEEIKKVQARYFRFLDTKQWDRIPAIFTDDAHLELDGNKFDDPTAFVAMMKTVIGEAPTVHHCHMPEIELTGPDTAEAIWAMEDLLSFPAAADAPPGHRGYGHYTETLRRVDGKWLIERMVLTRTRMDPLANWTPAD